MNAVNQFLLNSNNKLSYYENSKEDYVNTSSFNAKEKFDDIWNEAHTELQERYSLPAFHLWESGFTQGDASDNEVFEAKDSINEEEYYKGKEVIEGNTFAPTVSAAYNEDETEVITDIYEFLDKKLLEIVEPKTEKLIEEYEAFCSAQLS